MDIEDYPLHPLCPRRVWAWMNTCAPLTNGDVLISLRQINTLAIIDRETGSCGGFGGMTRGAISMTAKCLIMETLCYLPTA